MVTIVVLIILATISINAVFGENGIIKRAEASKRLQEISKARESLSLTLTNAGIEKRVNKKYNQDEFLDDFILGELPGAKIKGDIVIIDGNAFELDRSVPQIGKYVGKEDELKFPNVEVNTVVAEDSKTATIAITAIEEESGIHKIEIIQNGNVIKDYTYDNVKEEVKEEFSVKQNGNYTIKVYSNLTSTEKTKVEGIITPVKFSPNGEEKYKKEHSVTITAEESSGKVTSIKYQWLPTTVEPLADTFTQTCNNNETITGKGYTGEYFLWVLLETENGKTNICRSEAFYFDNEGPNITSVATEKYSGDGITINAMAQDTGLGIEKIEVYVDDKLQDTQTCEVTTEAWNIQSTITGLEMGTHNIKIVAYDAGNTAKEYVTTGTTMLHTWERTVAKLGNHWIWDDTKPLKTASAYYLVSGTYNNLFATKPPLDVGESYTSLSHISINVKKHFEQIGSGVDFWLQNGNQIGRYRYTSGILPSSDGDKVNYTVTWYQLEATQVPVGPGNGAATIVEDDSESTYPKNGGVGTYWYKYIGIQ